MNNVIMLELKTPLLNAKLRAVAKHMNALADELDIIENTVCPECGGKLNPKRKTGSPDIVFCACKCCKYTGYHKKEYFDTSNLPDI